LTLERSEYRAELRFWWFDFSAVETHKCDRRFGKLEKIIAAGFSARRRFIIRQIGGHQVRCQW
jgi:hypothetical protein